MSETLSPSSRHHLSNLWHGGSSTSLDGAPYSESEEVWGMTSHVNYGSGSHAERQQGILWGGAAITRESGHRALLDAKPTFPNPTDLLPSRAAWRARRAGRHSDRPSLARPGCGGGRTRHRAPRRRPRHSRAVGLRVAIGPMLGGGCELAHILGDTALVCFPVVETPGRG
jgi:hypothetical protein